MSIFIKGIDLPKHKDGERCIVIRGDGRVTTLTGADCDWMQAIQVKTPHGRIVDIDAVLDGINNADDGLTCGELIKQTTIIEAEE